MALSEESTRSLTNMIRERREKEKRARMARQRLKATRMGKTNTTKPTSTDSKVKTSAVHAGGDDTKGKTDARAKAQKARLKRANAAKTKAEPRGPTKAAKNLAKLGKVARGANLAGAAAAYGGLIADTMNPATPQDLERQRRLAELMRRNEAY